MSTNCCLWYGVKYAETKHICISLCVSFQYYLSVISAEGRHCLRCAKNISAAAKPFDFHLPRVPPEAHEGYLTCDCHLLPLNAPTSLTPLHPNISFYSLNPLSSPLQPIGANNTPLTAPPSSQQASVEFIQIFWHFASPHFPSRNDLWQLEMGFGQRSFLQHPAFFFSYPSIVKRPTSLLWLLSFFLSLSLYSLLLPLSAAAGLESPPPHFCVWLHSVIDKLGDIPRFVDILCLLSFLCVFLLTSHLLFDPVLTPCIGSKRV